LVHDILRICDEDSKLFSHINVSFARPCISHGRNTQTHGRKLSNTHADVWDTLGTNLQNVTKDVTKWRLDDAGRKQKFHGHKITQRQEHEETSAPDVPDSNGGGPHSTDLTPQNSRAFHAAHHWAMVDFYAPWCIWCQRLAPAWERFAMEVKEKRIDLGVGRVDCVAHQQMCKDERVMAFPTLRWMEDGKAVMPDYRGDRTAEGLVEYAERRVNDGKGGKNDNNKNNRALTINEWDEEHHPGCQVSGYLMVNRVPGNMHVEAKSSHHEINSAMTNLTHRVNHLSFGPPRAPNYNFLALFGDALPSTYRHSNPMKGRLYPTEEYHTAFHHHMKIVSSRADYLPSSSSSSSSSSVVYQILEESQVVAYEVQEIPEIKFLWDMSPMSVSLEKEGRRWYEYVTNLLAIIGGTYTTLGLINATLLKLFKPKRL